MKSGCKSVLSEIGKTEKSGERNSPHTRHECALLSVEAIRPYALMPGKVKRFVFIGIVRFLEYGNVIRAALVQIAVLVRIYGVYLQPDHTKILPRRFTSLSDILNIALTAAFACEDKYLLHTAFGNDLHFMLYLLG